MRFYVYRRGYNSANNPAMSGGPEEVLVAEVEADNPDQAIQFALEAGVSCYNNQSMSSAGADAVDAKQAEVKRRVKLL